jgi:uncharacterized damage-inducible protein DinB
MATQHAVSSPPASTKEAFLATYDREHETTMRVLRAYPRDHLGLRPHAMCKTARELAWMFVAERHLATAVFHNQLASGEMPAMDGAIPDAWDAILDQIERAHGAFGDLVRRTPDADLHAAVKFFVGPKTMGDITRTELMWLFLHDEIHHRGQFSIYLRMAGGKVPSIYGPSADEPWM